MQLCVARLDWGKIGSARLALLFGVARLDWGKIGSARLALPC